MGPPRAATLRRHLIRMRTICPIGRLCRMFFMPGQSPPGSGRPWGQARSTVRGLRRGRFRRFLQQICRQSRSPPPFHTRRLRNSRRRSQLGIRPVQFPRGRDTAGLENWGGFRTSRVIFSDNPKGILIGSKFSVSHFCNRAAQAKPSSRRRGESDPNTVMAAGRSER